MTCICGHPAADHRDDDTHVGECAACDCAGFVEETTGLLWGDEE